MQDDNGSLYDRYTNLGRYGLGAGYSSHGFYGSVPYSDDDYASRTYANLINQQYADYRQRFLPYEQRLMEMANNSQLLDEQLGRISTNIDNSFGSRGMQQRIMNERYGLTMNTNQQTKQDKMSGIDRALATAHANNNTRIAHSDLQNSILTGASTAQQSYTNTREG